MSTITQLARENGRTPRQIDYAIRAHQIEPSFRVGITRLFDATAAAKVRAALARIGPRRLA